MFPGLSGEVACFTGSRLPYVQRTNSTRLWVASYPWNLAEEVYVKAAAGGTVSPKLRNTAGWHLMQMEQKKESEREGTESWELYVVAAHAALLRAGGMSLGDRNMMLTLDRGPLTPT